MQQELDEKGYLIFRNIIDPSSAYEAIRDKEVNYVLLKQFIQSKMLDTVNKQLGWDARYTKFRVSDNNNSADASAFHRDIFSQDYADPVVPSFTCLKYLDTTVMELIPGTHKLPAMSYIDALRKFGERVRMTINPGDILIFYSTLLHRGIFTEGLKHRRLIQVFEVFPTQHELDLYSNSIIHVEGREKYSNSMIWASKQPVLSDIINWLGYLNAATGYGVMYGDCLVPNSKYLSSEGLRGRLHVVNGTWQPINKYIMNIATRDLPKDCYDNFQFICYGRQYITYIIIALILVAVIIYLLVLLYRAIFRKKRGKKLVK